MGRGREKEHTGVPRKCNPSFSSNRQAGLDTTTIVLSAGHGGLGGAILLCSLAPTCSGGRPSRAVVSWRDGFSPLDEVGRLLGCKTPKRT